MTGYEKFQTSLQTSLQSGKRSIEHLQKTLLAQQRQIEICAKQDMLIESLARHLEIKSYALEALEAKFQRQGHEYQSAEAAVSAAQQELGMKRKRIEDLHSDSISKQQKIEQLEQEAQCYRGICSYMAARTLVDTSALWQLHLILVTVSDFAVCTAYICSCNE